MPNNDTTPNKWTVNLEEDPVTKDLLLPFPPDLLSQIGWSEGTELWWIDNQDGTFSIKKKDDKDDSVHSGS